MNNIIKEIKYGMKKKTMTSCVLGLFLSLIFTCMSFSVVKFNLFPAEESFYILISLAVAQFFSQLVFFLRLNIRTSEAMENMMPFLFSISIIFLLVFGSLWIMHNLGCNMPGVLVHTDLDKTEVIPKFQGIQDMLLHIKSHHS